VQAAPTTGLDPAGDEVLVTVTGLPDDVGVYVRLCALPASGRPGADACDGQGIWVRETYPYGPFPTDGSVVKPSAGAVTLPVAASFGSVDCTTLACGVHVRRDHLGASDTSYDRAIPLTFASATSTTTTSASPSPTTTTTSPSPTSTTTPEVSLDAGSVEPGGTLEVTASGFDAGERVVATMFSEPVELGEGDADASGTVRLSLEVPADAAAGEHTLQLVGQSSGVVAETTFTVAEAETTRRPSRPRPTTRPTRAPRERTAPRAPARTTGRWRAPAPRRRPWPPSAWAWPSPASSCWPARGAAASIWPDPRPPHRGPVDRAVGGSPACVRGRGRRGGRAWPGMLGS
jgi:hypothetical protein